jgi:NRPS condensation-like uncharacterized protein
MIAKRFGTYEDDDECMIFVSGVFIAVLCLGCTLPRKPYILSTRLDGKKDSQKRNQDAIVRLYLA